MIFVDTGAWVGRYATGDQYAVDARRCWLDIESRRQVVMTSNLVLAELGNLLTARSPGHGRFAAERLRQIYDSNAVRIVRPDEVDEQDALELVDKFSDQKLGFTDAVSMILMRRHNIRRVFTFDRHFKWAGFDCVPTRKSR